MQVLNEHMYMHVCIQVLNEHMYVHDLWKTVFLFYFEREDFFIQHQCIFKHSIKIQYEKLCSFLLST